MSKPKAEAVFEEESLDEDALNDVIGDDDDDDDEPAIPPAAAPKASPAKPSFVPPPKQATASPMASGEDSLFSGDFSDTQDAALSGNSPSPPTTTGAAKASAPDPAASDDYSLSYSASMKDIGEPSGMS